MFDVNVILAHVKVCTFTSTNNIVAEFVLLFRLVRFDSVTYTNDRDKSRTTETTF